MGDGPGWLKKAVKCAGMDDQEADSAAQAVMRSGAGDGWESWEAQAREAGTDDDGIPFVYTL